MVNANLVKELREITGAGMLDCKKALEECQGDIEKAIDWLREKGISKAAKKADRIAAEGLASVLVDGNNAVIVEVNSETDFVAKNDEFKALVSAISNVLINSDVNTVEEALNLPYNDGTINDLIVAKTATIGEKLSLRRFARLTKNDNEQFGSYTHMGGKIVVLAKFSGITEEAAKDVAMHIAAMKPLYIRRENVPAEVIEKERTILKEQAMNEGKPADIAEKMVEGRIQKYYKEVCLEEQPFIKDGDIDVATHIKNNGGSIIEMVRYEVGEGMEKRQDNFAEEVMNQINSNK